MGKLEDKASKIIEEVEDKIKQKFDPQNKYLRLKLSLDGLYLKDIKNKYKERSVILEAVYQNGNALEYAGWGQNNYEIAIAAIYKNQEAFRFVSSDLKNNQKFIIEALSYNSTNIKYASNELLENKDFILKAIPSCSVIGEYIDNNLIKDNKIMKKLAQYGYLEYASKELQNDKEIVLRAVRNMGIALEYASKELQNDKDIVTEAAKCGSIEFASKELKNDKKIHPKYTPVSESPLSGCKVTKI